MLSDQIIALNKCLVVNNNEALTKKITELQMCLKSNSGTTIQRPLFLKTVIESLIEPLSAYSVYIHLHAIYLSVLLGQMF